MLTAERDGLRGNEDPVRDKLRQAAAARRSGPWTAEETARLQQEVGPEWRWQPDQDGRMAMRRTAELADWPVIQRVVAGLAAKPGLAIETMELRAGGVGRDRRFTHVEIVLRLPKDGNPSANSFRSDPKGPGTGSTTKTNNPKEIP